MPLSMSMLRHAFDEHAERDLLIGRVTVAEAARDRNAATHELIDKFANDQVVERFILSTSETLYAKDPGEALNYLSSVREHAAGKPYGHELFQASNGIASRVDNAWHFMIERAHKNPPEGFDVKKHLRSVLTSDAPAPARRTALNKLEEFETKEPPKPRPSAPVTNSII